MKSLPQYNNNASAPLNKGVFHKIIDQITISFEVSNSSGIKIRNHTNFSKIRIRINETFFVFEIPWKASAKNGAIPRRETTRTRGAIVIIIKETIAQAGFARHKNKAFFAGFEAIFSHIKSRCGRKRANDGKAKRPNFRENITIHQRKTAMFGVNFPIREEIEIRENELMIMRPLGLRSELAAGKEPKRPDFP